MWQGGSVARVLVTGGAGFVGSHVVRRLLDQNHEVMVFDFFHQYIWPISPTYVENMSYRFNVLLKGAEIQRGNTLNSNALRDCIRGFRPSHIIHMAAMPLANIAARGSEEAFRNIVEGTFNLLEVLKPCRSWFKKLVYISSSMVYGDFEQEPMPEEGRTEPKGIYGGMKLAGEQLVRTYSQVYSLPCAIVRPSAVYGPTDNNRRVLQIFVENAVQGLPIRVNSDESSLDFSFVDDVARGIVLVTLCSEGACGIFNVTRGEARTLREAAEILQQHFPGLSVSEFHGSEGYRPQRGALEILKARVLGYSSCYSLERGLAEYIAFVKTHNRSLSNVRELQ